MSLERSALSSELTTRNSQLRTLTQNSELTTQNCDLELRTQNSELRTQNFERKPRILTMMVPLLSIGFGALALEPLIAAVADRAESTGSDGAVATFLGLVRNHNAGRQVLY